MESFTCNLAHMQTVMAKVNLQGYDVHPPPSLARAFVFYLHNEWMCMYMTHPIKPI